jgi:hypothetical protein
MMKRRIPVVALALGLTVYSSTGSPGHAEEKQRADLALLFEGEVSTYGDVRSCIVVERSKDTGFNMRKHLVAQGEGRFEGSRLKGSLSFSQLARRLPEHPHCTTLITGFLETENGQEIFFEGTGYAVPGQGERDPLLYTVSLRFEEPGAPYEWLRTVPAIWEGVTDVPARRVRYRVYAPGPERREVQ